MSNEARALLDQALRDKRVPEAVADLVRLAHGGPELGNHLVEFPAAVRLVPHPLRLSRRLADRCLTLQGVRSQC